MASLATLRRRFPAFESRDFRRLFWDSFFASASNTSMKAAPMRLRLVSGSLTPARRSRNKSSACTCTNGML